MTTIPLAASDGPVVSGRVKSRQVGGLEMRGVSSLGHFVHVFKPSYSLYEPLGLYPDDTTGGMLQQASLWPWLAGMVDILAVGVRVGLVDELVWQSREELDVGWGDDERRWWMLEKRRA
jgi:hypothetical protein